MISDLGMFTFTPIIHKPSIWEKTMSKEVGKLIKKAKRKPRDPSMKHVLTVYCSQEEFDQFKEAVKAEGSDTSTEVRRMMKGYTMRREVFEDE